MSHTYLLSWDCLGLEACINISDIDKEIMWDSLNDTGDNSHQGRPQSVGSIVNMLQLRARYNNQRFYEIYVVDTDDTVTADDLKSMFDDDPQGSADLIRQRGRVLYSDRQKAGLIKIR
jgi:hypothetical protein